MTGDTINVLIINVLRHLVTQQEERKEEKKKNSPHTPFIRKKRRK